RVPALQGREADGAVFLEVASIADADPGGVEELRGGCEDGGLVGRGRPQVLVDLAANPAEHLREVGQMRVLRQLALLAPFWVIDVLLAALLVPAGRLDVAAWVDAEPDVYPGRRHGKRGEAAAHGGIAHGAAFLVAVG